MHRRDFLKILGIGIAAPKLIFDMGANLYKQEPYRGYRILEEVELIYDGVPFLMSSKDMYKVVEIDRATLFSHPRLNIPSGGKVLNEPVVYNVPSPPTRWFMKDDIILFNNGSSIKLT